MPSRRRSRILLDQLEELTNRADEERRELNTEERAKAEHLLKRAREASDLEAEMKKIDADVLWEHGSAGPFLMRDSSRVWIARCDPSFRRLRHGGTSPLHRSAHARLFARWSGLVREPVGRQPEGQAGW